jgi:TetR/AcrR family transcriptional repressor of nem operon
MVNTLLEMATEDDEIRKRVTEYLSRIEHHFYLRLEQARLQGEIESDADCDSLAKMLMTGIWGLRVMSTTRPDIAIYSGITSYLLSALPIVKR